MNTDPKSIHAEALAEEMSYAQICQAWAMSDHWPLDDAVRLVLGHPPRLHHPAPLDATAEGQFRLIKQLAINCFGESLQPVAAETHDGEVHLKPREFLKWAESRRIEIPMPLWDALERSYTFGLGYEPPELRESQRHRERSRAVAAVLWRETPDLTKAEVAAHPDIKTIGCQGKEYAAKTIQDWIKEENPNRRPGRRKKKATP